MKILDAAALNTAAENRLNLKRYGVFVINKTVTVKNVKQFLKDFNDIYFGK